MNLFSIPEDIAYELSRIDLDFESHEILPIYDIYNHPVAQYIGRENFRTCKKCGEPYLRMTETKHGWRLTYATGKLEGKIYACPSEAE